MLRCPFGRVKSVSFFLRNPHGAPHGRDAQVELCVASRQIIQNTGAKVTYSIIRYSDAVNKYVLHF